MLALLFPGQGAQEVGMGRDVFEASPAARAVFEIADRVLDLPLSRLCFEGPEEELVRTEIQQPAILATSMALLRALEERVTLEPVAVAGHSLGEYTALVASGALALEDALLLVRARGRYMQEAVPEGRGAMAAVLGCGPELVERACDDARKETGRVVAPANYNGPSQTVIAGDAVAVERACNRARQLGARRALPLAVSAPFHCPLMEPAAEKLAPELERVRFGNPKPPVVSNVDATPNSEGERIRGLLAAQVTSPVRFTEMVEQLRAMGVSRVLEVGPGRVLTGLVARIAPDLGRLSLYDADGIGAVAAALVATAG
ncbi:[acyl-carrier-protein] S-malonyltransferase [Myxococcaceae bacterium]|nr:[acyl-carrier-protein] S-malonyltransferase [Myxococcaceae bacterium]